MSRGHERWRPVAGYLAQYSAVGALYPFLPVYYATLGFGLQAIGLLGAAFAVAALVGAPLWGATADHLGAARPVLSVAALAASVSAAGLALSQGSVPIVLSAVALSLMMAGIGPILDARAMEIVGAGRGSYGRMRVWGSLSFIGAVLLTGWLVEAFGISTMFAVLVIALVATAVVGFGIRSRPAVAPLPGRAALAAVARTPMIMAFLGVVLLAWTSSTAINAFFSIHLVDIGAPESLVGASWALGAVVEVPIMIAFPSLQRRIGLERLLIAGAALFALRGVAVVLTGDPLLTTLTMLIHGAAFALVLVGGVVYVSTHAPRGAAASAQGMLAATVFGLAQVLGPGIGGVVARSGGLPTLFAIATAGSLAATVALAVVIGREQPGVPAGVRREGSAS